MVCAYLSRSRTYRHQPVFILDKETLMFTVKQKIFCSAHWKKAHILWKIIVKYWVLKGILNMRSWWWFNCQVVCISCDPVDCSPPESPVHGISQARILERVALVFSKGSSWPGNGIRNSCTAGGLFTVGPPEKPLWDSAAAAAKSLESCLTLCDPRDSSPPGSAIPGILQARTLEWVAISFSSAWKWKVKMKSLSGVRLFVTPWTAAYQAQPSMVFSRQEYWSGVPISYYWASWNTKFINVKIVAYHCVVGKLGFEIIQPGLWYKLWFFLVT